MNSERRQMLERLFDGEPAEDDPLDEQNDAESLAYLRKLAMLREIAQKHDPSAAIEPRRPSTSAATPLRRIAPALLAMAATLALIVVVRDQLRDSGDRKVTRVDVPSSAKAPIDDPIILKASRRPPRPSLEVQLYRWANASPSSAENVAGLVLSRRGGDSKSRRASREILALELANAEPGSTPRIPRLKEAGASTVTGSSRKSGSTHRPRYSHSPRA